MEALQLDKFPHRKPFLNPRAIRLTVVNIRQITSDTRHVGHCNDFKNFPSAVLLMLLIQHLQTDIDV